MVKGREGRENPYENLEPDIIKTRPYSGHNHSGRAIHKPNMSQTSVILALAALARHNLVMFHVLRIILPA